MNNGSLNTTTMTSILAELIYPYWMETAAPEVWNLSKSNPFTTPGSHRTNMYNNFDRLVNADTVNPPYSQLSVAWDIINHIGILTDDEECVMYELYDNLLLFCRCWLLVNHNTYTQSKSVLQHDNVYIPKLLLMMDKYWGVLRCGPYWIHGIDDKCIRDLQEWIDIVYSAIVTYLSSTTFDRYDQSFRDDLEILESHVNDMNFLVGRKQYLQQHRPTFIRELQRIEDQQTLLLFNSSTTTQIVIKQLGSIHAVISEQ